MITYTFPMSRLKPSATEEVSKRGVKYPRYHPLAKQTGLNWFFAARQAMRPSYRLCGGTDVYMQTWLSRIRKGLVVFSSVSDLPGGQGGWTPLLLFLTPCF